MAMGGPSSAQSVTSATTRLLAEERLDPRVRAAFHRSPGLEWPTGIGLGVLAITPTSPPPGAKQLWKKDGLITQEHQLARFGSRGEDRQPLDIVVTRPCGAAALPCVLYLHGGAMAFQSAFDPTYKVFSRILAHQGLCVVLPDFRNSTLPSRDGQPTGPYPAGLDDCFAALQWVHSNQRLLGCTGRVIVAGESGGGNLALALAMKCEREGQQRLLQGFYAICPYIAGSWPQRKGLESEILGESHLDRVNGGLGIVLDQAVGAATAYGLKAFKERDPLAWPGFATVADVKGLPPGVIRVNECDPLRDEGINFYRLLLRAGVDVQCLMTMGTIHGGELAAGITPDITSATARSIADHAHGRIFIQAKL